MKNGITINNICPGDTPHVSFDEAVRAAKDPARGMPARPSPPDIAEIAVWLCSDAARYVSGSNIWVLGRESM
jgi:NAD(P)-dependent dehydrogenase (short-subunit alcohol dehydrogenase family)